MSSGTAMASTSASLKCLRPKQISIRPHSKNKTKKQTKKKGKKKKKKKEKKDIFRPRASRHALISPFPFLLGTETWGFLREVHASQQMDLCQCFSVKRLYFVYNNSLREERLSGHCQQGIPAVFV